MIRKLSRKPSRPNWQREDMFKTEANFLAVIKDIRPQDEISHFVADIYDRKDGVLNELIGYAVYDNNGACRDFRVAKPPDRTEGQIELIHSRSHWKLKIIDKFVHYNTAKKIMEDI